MCSTNNLAALKVSCMSLSWAESPQNFDLEVIETWLYTFACILFPLLISVSSSRETLSYSIDIRIVSIVNSSFQNLYLVIALKTREPSPSKVYVDFTKRSPASTTDANSIFRKVAFLPSCKSSSNFLCVVGAVSSCFSKNGVTSPN